MKLGPLQRSLIPHIILALFVFVITSPALGYRFLWQDEIDTAQYGQTIADFGYPRAIDGRDQVNVNTGGFELEDKGYAVLYEPLPQFYVAAAGIIAGRVFHLSPDFAVRLPFVLAHAAVSGIASYGLSALSGIPQPLALAAGLALGVQSVRVVHNRTARYHALLDMLTALACLFLGMFNRNKQYALLLYGISIAGLVLTHFTGGAAIAISLTGLYAAIFCLPRALPKKWRQLPDPRHTSGITAFVGLFLPWIVSLLLISLQVRPWIPGSAASAADFTLLRPPDDLLTVIAGFPQSVIFLVVCFACAIICGKFRLALHLAVIYGALLFGTWISSAHPQAQPRYYLSAPLLLFLWPIALGFRAKSSTKRALLGIALLIALLAPEVIERCNTPGWRCASPSMHGMRVIWQDLRMQNSGIKQPLHQAVEYIREHGHPGEQVLFDYVPQYANWYLPEFQVAMMPDRSFITARNMTNPLWSRPKQMPKWHIWYPTWRTGPWRCLNQCDYMAKDYSPTLARYVLESKELKTSFAYCVVRTWKTPHWLNAPFVTLSTAQDPASGVMVLARPCR